MTSQERDSFLVSLAKHGVREYRETTLGPDGKPTAEIWVVFDTFKPQSAHESTGAMMPVSDPYDAAMTGNWPSPPNAGSD